MIDTNAYEKMTWETPSDELEDAVGNLLAEVERLREQNELMVKYFRYMRDCGLTDADWITVNEWIGDDEE